MAIRQNTRRMSIQQLRQLQTLDYDSDSSSDDNEGFKFDDILEDHSLSDSDLSGGEMKGSFHQKSSSPTRRLSPKSDSLHSGQESKLKTRFAVPNLKKHRWLTVIHIKPRFLGVSPSDDPVALMVPEVRRNSHSDQDKTTQAKPWQKSNSSQYGYRRATTAYSGADSKNSVYRRMAHRKSRTPVQQLGVAQSSSLNAHRREFNDPVHAIPDEKRRLNVVHVGEMEKIGQVMRKWRRRWFVLCDDGVLYYFLSKIDADSAGLFEATWADPNRWKPRGRIPLQTITSVRRHSTQGREFCLQVYVKSTSILYI